MKVSIKKKSTYPKLFLTIALCSLLFPPNTCQATGVYLDFNDFPVTTGKVPDNSINWEYASSTTNFHPANVESSTAGWKMKTERTDGVHWFYRTKFDSCYDHIGVDTYGYFKITNQGHTGNALSYTITGGKGAQNISTATCASYGASLFNLESYTGISDIFTGGNIGHPYIYFKKLNQSLTMRDTSPYIEASGANRFSLYVWRPSGVSNGVGGYGQPVKETFQIGLFRNPESTGYHHYFNYLVQGGGWIKVQVEETTNGDNGGNSSTRYISGLLNTVWQWYITSKAYSGGLTPPYEYRYDDIVFEADNYSPQNNETISNIAVLYKDSIKSWEISFNDKYKNAYAYSTYEARYSFSPITNENWNNATPVLVQADTRFYIQARTDGRFQKWWPYYQGVWAPFKLSEADTNRLTAGATVYFAIKDISQINNSTTPADGINGYWGTGKGGRNYDTYSSEFDYATDKTALPLIKRISYTLATPSSTMSAPKNLMKK